MKTSIVKIRDRRGRVRYGTKVQDGSNEFIFDRIVSKREARISLGLDGRKLGKSLASYRRFNGRDATKIVRQAVDLKTPFIRIGEVPLITYMSDKTGSMRAYKHETKIMPVLYLHPSKPIGILVGGSLKVRKWLED